MTEQMAAVAGVELCYETFGDAGDPAVLLIAGGGQSMVWWEDGFCNRLAVAGRHVIRYDHRDTGRSTSSPVGQPTYSSEDLATDPLRILDHLGIAAGHLVGLSLGGGIAQFLAASQPDRVLSLTLMSTSPAGPGTDDSGLPPMAPALVATFEDPDPEPDWDDRDAVVRYRVDAERPYAGSLEFDEQRIVDLAGLEVDRTINMASSMTNHFTLDDGWSGGSRLSDITAPTLILHGTADPFLPIGHGEALAREIPGAKLVALPGVGHQQPPPQFWDLTIAAIHEHTATW